MICPPPVHSSVPLNKMIVGKTTEDGGIALCATVDGVAVAFMTTWLHKICTSWHSFADDCVSKGVAKQTVVLSYGR